MEEIGLGSGVGSDGGFELSGAPPQPIAQRFTFESSGGLASAALAPEPPLPPQPWAANFATANSAAPRRYPIPIKSPI